MRLGSCEAWLPLRVGGGCQPRVLVEQDVVEDTQLGRVARAGHWIR